MTKVMTKQTRAHTLKPTQNPVSAEYRAQAIETLNKLILDTMSVSLAVRHIQWNMATPPLSPGFFEPAIQVLEDQSNLLAQRVHAIGGFVPMTAKILAHDSGIEAFPEAPLSDEEYKNAIIVRFAQLAKSVRHALQKADNMNEPVTSFYLTQTAVEVEKQLSIFEQQFAPAS